MFGNLENAIGLIYRSQHSMFWTGDRDELKPVRLQKIDVTEYLEG